MTINTSVRTAGPFSGAGAVVVCPFYFKVFAAADLLVVRTTAATGAQVTFANGGDYTVALNADQDASPGGTVTTTAVLAVGFTLLISSNVAETQGAVLSNQGGFYPKVVEAALDRAVVLIQQIRYLAQRALRVPEVGVLTELPTVANRALKLLGFDSGGQPIAVAPTSGSAADLALDLASYTAANEGAGQVGFAYSLQYPSNTTGAQANYYINAQVHGALADGSTDNTTAVQAALNALGARGGLVQVKRGTRFNLKNLTFPIRSNLDYWMDDDLSAPNPSTTLGTNERVLFQANANASGIVNEHRVTGAFHPSWNIDLRRDVAGHDTYLGVGQARVPTSSIPARMSWNMFDQQVDTFRTIYEVYGAAYSQFSGVTSHAWRRVVTVTGVGTGAGGWVSVPAVGTEITGSVSGAKGWFLSANSNTTTILWNSGKFAAGDALTDNNETTVNTASSVAFALTPMQPLGTDLRKGNWSVGLPVGLGGELLNVGGRVALLPSRSFSQHIDKTITHPGLVLADLVSDVPTNGFAVHYDTTAAAASRRLTTRNILSGTEQTADAAHVNSCRAHCTFGNAGGVSTSAFNIASVTRASTGRYDIVFTRALERADYAVSINLEEASTKGGYPLSKTVNGFTLAVATLGGTVAVDLASAASVVVFGGDI